MQKNRGPKLLVIALISCGLVVFYLNYYGKEGEKEPTFHKPAKGVANALEENSPDSEGITVESPSIQAPQERLEEILAENAAQNQTMNVEDECQKTERELRELFSYLDEKDYVRELKIGEDTFSRFKKIIHDLSLYPPLPAGEGISYEKIIENIYHFYRALNLKDLKLIRLIAKNEADSMEINLALFYKWLVSGAQCTRKGGLPPSSDTLYRYAGFLVNSIGGRAYLFRRETRLRLLLSYYSLLIVHEADKKKMNSFGLDISPFLEPLAEEIENFQLLYFRREYASKLIDVKHYYIKKRKTS
jgi:hypothetical protein